AQGGAREGRESVVIRLVLLEGRDRYERVMEGWVDNTQEDAVTHTVRVSDDDRALELAVEALPSPSYLIRAARCQAVSGAFDPEVPAGIGRLAGTQMIGGLSRRVGELTGAGAGADFALGARVEAAPRARPRPQPPDAPGARA